MTDISKITTHEQQGKYYSYLEQEKIKKNKANEDKRKTTRVKDNYLFNQETKETNNLFTKIDEYMQVIQSATTNNTNNNFANIGI